MVRASDYNGTLKRREFEPRLRIFVFFSLFYNSLHKLLAVYCCNTVETANNGTVELLFTLICCRDG